mmetsp:Transcript_45028/g.96662  ORF Transcript_45028/g.96662 Transcript_45028/m.96662 type:complete len:256 (+) Transcript_45028:79-846(+)|eukprot:CAMPEP_0206543760 /NCGR_PEP_ID=MMETSP0325_2-20121206/11087_1 /ASSEMBLY_ACC=CAM_ASM_000347 /TAXON_ID=2866 /ORGANISM="Crypthecodinium cohnii, Strain Seligo" /LENGTH=255 /DNA_ID=CAMNT_0054042325 /DNA_START=28 /DNA_END=795 /DNA_ORIENTATION=-
MALEVAWTMRPFGVGPAAESLGRTGPIYEADNLTRPEVPNARALLYGKLHAEEALLPGLYRVSDPAGLPVSEAFEISSTTTGRLQLNQTFEVSKIPDCLDCGYLRARLSFPCKGWISLQCFSVDGRSDLVQRLEASKQEPQRWASQESEQETEAPWSSPGSGSLQAKGTSAYSIFSSCGMPGYVPEEPGVSKPEATNSPGAAPPSTVSSLPPTLRTSDPMSVVPVRRCAAGVHLPISSGRVIVVSRGKPLRSDCN